MISEEEVFPAIFIKPCNKVIIIILVSLARGGRGQVIGAVRSLTGIARSYRHSLQVLSLLPVEEGEGGGGGGGERVGRGGVSEWVNFRFVYSRFV